MGRGVEEFEAERCGDEAVGGEHLPCSQLRVQEMASLCVNGDPCALRSGRVNGTELRTATAASSGNLSTTDLLSESSVASADLGRGGRIAMYRFI